MGRMYILTPLDRFDPPNDAHIAQQNMLETQEQEQGEKTAE